MTQKEIRTFIQLGESLCITLPKGWIDYYHIKAGDKAEVTTGNKYAGIKLINNNNSEGKEKNTPV